MWSNQLRSVLQLMAMPCVVMYLLPWTPGTDRVAVSGEMLWPPNPVHLVQCELAAYLGAEWKFSALKLLFCGCAFNSTCTRTSKRYGQWVRKTRRPLTCSCFVVRTLVKAQGTISPSRCYRDVLFSLIVFHPVNPLNAVLWCFCVVGPPKGAGYIHNQDFMSAAYSVMHFLNIVTSQPSQFRVLCCLCETQPGNFFFPKCISM